MVLFGIVINEEGRVGILKLISAITTQCHKHQYKQHSALLEMFNNNLFFYESEKGALDPSLYSFKIILFLLVSDAD